MNFKLATAENEKIVAVAKRLYQIQIERMLEQHGKSLMGGWIPPWSMLGQWDRITFCEMALAAKEELSK